MPSNQTPNYALNRWSKGDRVLMEDFNADNTKIDAALAALAGQTASKADQSALNTLAGQTAAKAEQSALTAEIQARTAAVSAINTALAARGNCEIWTTNYTGTGTFGQDKLTSVTFPKLPLFALIIGSNGDMMPLVPGVTSSVYHAPGDGGRTIVLWSGNTASWYASVYPSSYSQMNASGLRYYVFAFYAAG